MQPLRHSGILTILALITALPLGASAGQTAIQQDPSSTTRKGLDIPSIGLGLWNSKGEDVSPPFGCPHINQHYQSSVSRWITDKYSVLCLSSQATHAVEYAFKAGYDHFDSAAAYGKSCSQRNYTVSPLEADEHFKATRTMSDGRLMRRTLLPDTSSG